MTPNDEGPYGQDQHGNGVRCCELGDRCSAMLIDITDASNAFHEALGLPTTPDDKRVYNTICVPCATLNPNPSITATTLWDVLQYDVSRSLRQHINQAIKEWINNELDHVITRAINNNVPEEHRKQLILAAAQELIHE